MHKSMQCFSGLSFIIYFARVQKLHPQIRKSLKPCRAAHAGSNASVVPVIVNWAEANSEF